MIRVGYFEGTNSSFLSGLAARGVETVPLSNGVDSHGKYIGHITNADELSLVVGYLHKVMPLASSGQTPAELLETCRLYRIPVLIIVPQEMFEMARRVLVGIDEQVTLVDTAELRGAYEKAVG